jgi:integrase
MSAQVYNLFKSKADETPSSEPKAKAKECSEDKETVFAKTKTSNLYLHRESGVYYVRKNFKAYGIPALSKSTGEKTLGAAKTKMQVMIQQHLNRHMGIDDSAVILRKVERTVKFVADKVLEEHSAIQRVGTERNHQRYVNEIVRVWGTKDINSITSDTFDELIKTLKSEAPKVNPKTGQVYKKRTTYFDYYKAASLIMSFAYSRRWCTHRIEFKNPDTKSKQIIESKQAKDIPLTAEEQEILELKHSRALTRAEVNALWDVMDENLRDQFALSLGCMMRLREMLHLTWDRVNLETGEITLRVQDVKTGSKTGKGRQFKMTPLAHERLKERYVRLQKLAARYSKSSQTRASRVTWSAYVFPGWSMKEPGKDKPANQNKRAWKNALKKALIEERTRWHDLRHTGLTWALLGDPSLTMEQRQLMRQEPLLVSEYAGVSLKTIQSVYLKTDAKATASVADAIRVFSLEDRTENAQNF